jgi:hypothetical protein
MTIGLDGQHGCWLNAAEGYLAVDRAYGTAIRDELGRSSNGGNAGHVPVMWPPGYTGRLVNFHVVVLDGAGNVVAETGRRYRIEGAQDQNEMGQWGWVACGAVTPK